MHANIDELSSDSYSATVGQIHNSYYVRCAKGYPSRDLSSMFHFLLKTISFYA